MPYPPFPTISYSYTNFQQEQQSAPFPGTNLDADLQKLATSDTAIINFMKSVIRSDGRLNNGIVTADSLADGLLLGLPSPTDWETATDYTTSNTVWFGSALYRCLEDHTSGVFATDLAAGKWTLGMDISGKQDHSANLDAWSELATSTKQDASPNLTALAASAASGRAYLDVSGDVATVTALKALDTAAETATRLNEEGREGNWNLLVGDYTAEVAGDPGGAWWLKADDSLASVKAWRRARDYAEGAPLAFFGALGNNNPTTDTQGVADACLWAASQADKNLGAKILVGPHTYRIGSTQRVRAPMLWDGVGTSFMNQFSSTLLDLDGAVFKLEAGVNANMFECWLDTTLWAGVQDYRGFMTFTRIGFHGNRSVNANPGNIDLNNAGSGIVAKGTRYVLVEDCNVVMFAHDGVRTDSFDYGAGVISSNNIEIRNNRIHNNNRRGLDIAAGDGAIQENSVGYNGSDGIRSLGVAELANNWVWNSVGNGIVLGANADTLVIGNKSYDNQKSGFVLSSDLPGGLIVGNTALRNNAATVPWTDPIDTSGFYIGTDSNNLSLVGNQSHNLYGSNIKQQLYGFYFNHASCIAQFDGNNAIGNLTQNVRVAAPTNIKYHSDTSTNRGRHPGVEFTGLIDMANNGVRNIQNITGNGWVAKTISANDLAIGNDSHCVVTPAGAETLNTITSTATGLMHVWIRNGSAANSITVTHSATGIRCPNGVSATIGPNEMAHFIFVSGVIWQMAGT